MSQPNLFDYATSELSQDAFLAWLINWADESNKKHDEALNRCAVSFVRRLLQKDDSFSVHTVEVAIQWKKIDVSVLVNNEYFLVIEDKKGSKEHSDQLIRYSDIAREHYKDSEIRIELVYFKMEEQGQYSKVKDAGFTPFHRSEMLAILAEYIESTASTNLNNILVDYFSHLKGLDRKIKSYQVLPLEDWNPYSWHGFYAELQKHVGGEWGYVPNPSGGFLGFWWHWYDAVIDEKEFKIYLQLEQSKFIFKITSNIKEERGSVRSHFRKHLFLVAKELGIRISQYGRLGKYMGAAILNSEYRITNKEGLLDLDATMEKLKEMMKLMDGTKARIDKLQSVNITP
jgi:hypothetical protein